MYCFAMDWRGVVISAVGDARYGKAMTGYSSASD